MSRRQFGALVGTAFLVSGSGCSSLLGNAPADRVLAAYREGYSAYRTGTEHHNEAVIAYQGDEYSTVQDRIAEALEPLETARASFRRSRDLAAEHDMVDARKVATAALEKTGILIESSRLLGRTAKRFEAEEYEKAQRAYDDYRERMAAFKQTRMYSPQELDEVLDTGFLGL